MREQVLPRHRGDLDMNRKHSTRYWVLGSIGLALALLVFFPIQARISANSLIGSPAPAIKSPTWINSPGIDWPSLRGKVVLVDMWTFG